MEKLPESFVILNDWQNEKLWKKYIKWLKEKTNKDFRGEGFYHFYWVDWNSFYLNKYAYSYKEITLEEWDRIVNNKEVEFKLGERIAVSNLSEKEALEDIKTEADKYFYTWGITKEWRHLVEKEGNFKNFEEYKYIAKIPKIEIEYLWKTIELTKEEFDLIDLYNKYENTL